MFLSKQKAVTITGVLVTVISLIILSKYFLSSFEGFYRITNYISNNIWLSLLVVFLVHANAFGGLILWEEHRNITIFIGAGVALFMFIMAYLDFSHLLHFDVVAYTWNVIKACFYFFGFYFVLFLYAYILRACFRAVGWPTVRIPS